MSSTMTLRCLLQRIPRRPLTILLPRLARAVPPPAASRSMTALSEAEAREFAAEMYYYDLNEMVRTNKGEVTKINEAYKVMAEASKKEAIEMQRKCFELVTARRLSFKKYSRAVDNLVKVTNAAADTVAGFTLLGLVAIKYRYSQHESPMHRP